MVRGFAGRPGTPPTGSKIVFSVPLLEQSTTGPAQGVSDIHVVGSNGTFRRLTRMHGWAQEPQWSTDGRMIFFSFVSNPCPPETPNRTTWVVNADGAGLRRWPVSLGDPRVQFGFPFDLSRAASQKTVFVGLDSTGASGVVTMMNLDGSRRKQLTKVWSP
ncbi:MAG TPA: hypothetical protein VGK93_08925 [Candidatus Eisenbacteria bacterium]|jgi:Tol biopolymer transport system component